MNRSNFNQTGGFPLKTERLQELQTAFQTMNAFGSLAGNLTIISGCEVVGSTVKPGFVNINNELLEFREAILEEDSAVIIIEEPVNRAFENGTVKEVHKIRYATFGTAETSWLWSDFKRPIQTKELAEMFLAINNSLTTINTKLGTIEEHAKVQLQADWSQADETKKDFIKNKPTITQPFVYKGEYTVGDVFDEDLITISFPDIGITNYMVLGGILSKKADWTQDANVWHQTREHTATSFKLMLTEMAGGRFQNISFQYVIIAL